MVALVITLIVLVIAIFKVGGEIKNAIIDLTATIDTLAMLNEKDKKEE